MSAWKDRGRTRRAMMCHFDPHELEVTTTSPCSASCTNSSAHLCADSLCAPSANDLSRSKCSSTSTERHSFVWSRRLAGNSEMGWAKGNLPKPGHKKTPKTPRGRLCLNKAASDEIIWHCKPGSRCRCAGRRFNDPMIPIRKKTVGWVRVPLWSRVRLRRIGTTGPFWQALPVSKTSSPAEVRYDWIPRGTLQHIH